MASSPLVVSAPGKVILHGEHAVVYGKEEGVATSLFGLQAALATSVDLRCYLVLSQTVDSAVTLDLADFDHHMTWSLSTFNHWPESNESQLVYLKELSGSLSDSPPTHNMATLVFLYLLTHICREKLRELQGLRATVLSTLPASAGLGSSAAFSVCMAAGFLSLVGAITSTHRQQPEDSCSDEKLKTYITLPQSMLDRLHSLGVQLEAGGAIRFCSGQIHHFQKTPKLQILLVNTKVLRSTKKMVAGVRELLTKYPDVVLPILESIEAVTQKAESLLNNLGTISSTLSPTPSTEDVSKIYSGLQDLFVVNHHLLNAMGVGHKALDEVCAVAREMGLAAKLTGAGGGGCAIVLIPPDFSEATLAEVKQAFVTAGFDCWETTVGTDGVLAHNILT